jgi:hypothetical protein
MRLLEILPSGDFRLTGKLLGDAMPEYAILSHTFMTITLSPIISFLMPLE